MDKEVFRNFSMEKVISVLISLLEEQEEVEITYTISKQNEGAV